MLGGVAVAGAGGGSEALAGREVRDAHLPTACPFPPPTRFGGPRVASRAVTRFVSCPRLAWIMAAGPKQDRAAGERHGGSGGGRAGAARLQA
jgi:hypothetical protein